MAIRKPPRDPGPTVRAIISEAQRQGITAYAIGTRSGLTVFTVRRLLLGLGTPTIATVEAVAGALGMAIKVESRGSGPRVRQSR